MTGVNEVRRDLTGLLPRLWRFALYLTRDNTAAQDLVQSTCLRALEKAAQYRSNTKLDSWVFSIMASVWKNTLRSESRLDTDPGADVESVAFAGINVAELNTHTQQVLTSVSQLPDEQRAVVALVCIERCTYRDAAEALDIPIGTVMSRLATARKALAALNTDAAPGHPAIGTGKS